MKSILTLMAVAAVSAGLMSSPASAGELVKYKVVDGAIMQPLTSKPGDPIRGRETVIHRKQGNCIACHTAANLKDQQFHGEIGPSLDGVSERWNEGQLRLILVNSKKVFEGSIMPAFYKNTGYTRVNKKFKGKTILTPQQIEDVVAYLKTLN